MSQLQFFKTFGYVIADTIHDDQLAMRLVSKAWRRHRQSLRSRS